MENLWTIRFLRWFCPPQLLEEIEGDLMQRFERDVKSVGEIRARKRLLWNVIRFLRPGILLRNSFTYRIADFMILNNLKFSWRNIRRHQVFSVVNVGGLAMGIAVFLLILNFYISEKSFDKFFSRHADVVRVCYTRLIDNQAQFSKAQVFPAVAEALKESIPAVEQTTRLFPIASHVETVISIDNNGERQTFPEASLFAVDSTFLEVFPLEVYQGNKNQALSGKANVLLSETTAIKYFGHTDVLNKVIKWNGMGDFTITGVFKDLPANSHLSFELLFSWMEVYGDKSQWNWDGFYTYLLLKPGSDINVLQAQIQQVLHEKSVAQDPNNRIQAHYFLQPLTSIHLNSSLTGEIKPNGSAKVNDALLLIAIGVLLLAVINYMNLSIARTLKRYKEVGLRRIIGSTRMQLMNLFFTESFLLIALAFTVATGLILLVSPYFNSLSGRSIEMAIWQDKPAFLLLSLSGVVIFSWVAGSSLTRSLVAINSVSAIKSGSSGGNRGGLRKTLLLFQFLITLILVTASFLIQKQVHFLQTQELGFSAHQNLVVKTFAVAGEEVDSTFQSKIQLLKGQLSENALIESVTVTSNVPGRENEWIGRLSKNGNELISSSRTRVDKDFILTYGLTLTAGRNFENEQANQVILNQSAARMLGYDSDEKAIGNVLLGNSQIVGVVKDFHERSLHEPIRPCIYTPGQGYMKFITIRSNSDNWSQLLGVVEKDWNRVFPEKPFEYFFMDEFFNRQYGQDKRLSNVFFCFTLVGVTIACLGLFGFVYFVTHQRIKEIGIRKTLGASFQNLVLLLTSEFMVILFIAGVLAGPVSYYFLQEWLSKYPVHIELEVFDFLLPVLAVAVLALCSTGVLLVRAASVNPTEVLKNE